MVVIIKKNDSEKEVKTALKQYNKKKKTSTLADFYGKMKGKFGDGLTWQKQIRNEWD